MDTRAPITVDITIRNRNDMNTSTPRFGNWTYHHVQPVRVYYMTASLILRVITDANAYRDTRALAVHTLGKMCRYDQQRTDVREFVARTTGTVTTDDERQVIAKLCASPPFGGFGGPNPAQRSDDPHDGPERVKPRSADAVWWEALQRIGSTVFAAFGLHQMPVNGNTITATKMAYEWNDIVGTLLGDLECAALSGGAKFARTDWKVTDPAETSWIMVSPNQAQAYPGLRRAYSLLYPQLALRVSREQSSCLDPAVIPVASLERRGTVALVIRDDFLAF